MHFLKELNEIQYQAVTTIDGPVMINAGPGSGKTRVLTYRIAFILEQGVKPFNILALTFTNKSSKEMRNRIEKIVGTEARSLFMGTFHSVFAKILRTKANLLGYTNSFTIYDTDDAKTLLKQIVKDLKLNDKIYKTNGLYSRISNLKNNLINYKIYSKNLELVQQDIDSYRPLFGEIYKEYTLRCFQNNAMDFDDLLIKTFELIIKFPDVLYEFQHKFQYIMIDEFQDTNIAQFNIIQKIAAVHQNICVVGDDGQSIYAFRGANIQNILNFQSFYPNLTVFKLEQNYRSGNTIVQAANNVIKNNSVQLKKTIWTDKQETHKIKIISSFTDNDEGKEIVSDIIAKSNLNRISYNQIAILYRTNNQSRALEESLRRRNVPYIIYGGISFYSRKEVKDLLAYLKLIINPNDDECLKRIINYPIRGIGDTTLNKLLLLARQANSPLWHILENIEEHNSILQSRTISQIKEFVLMMQAFQIDKDQNPYQLAVRVANTSKIMPELYADKSVEGISRYENIQELLNSIKEYSENDEIEETLGDIIHEKNLSTYLQTITLLTDADTKTTTQDSVSLMTIHASKGLEFRSVYITGLEEGIFPSERSNSTNDDLEEERRLFYVAITRAEDFLTLSYAKSRVKFGRFESALPSRFLKEIPFELMDMPKEFSSKQNNTSIPNTTNYTWKNNLIDTLKKSNVIDNSVDFIADNPDKIKQGDKILHKIFGKGVVNAIEGENDKKIGVILFDNNGEKRIMLKMAKIKIL